LGNGGYLHGREENSEWYDSMGGTDRAKLEGLMQYLKDEYKAKNDGDGRELDDSEWTLVRCTKHTPRQRNGECSVHYHYFDYKLALLICFAHLLTLSKVLTAVYSLVCLVILLQTIVHLYSASCISTSASAERELLWLSLTMKQ